MELRNYSAKQCVVTVNDAPITGLGEDMVTIEKDEELFTTSVGAQGDVIVNEVHNDLYTVTLSVQAVSPSKKGLLDLACERKPFNISIQNASLGEKFAGTGRMKNFPSLENGAEAGDREFEIQVFNGTLTAMSVK